MTEKHTFQLELEHVADYEFRVKFDWPGVADLVLDEPAPLGSRRGPNASRLIAAGVANCLTASLLFCLRKSHAEPRAVKASVTGHTVRNDQGRLRLGGFEVTITVDGDPEHAARLARCNELFENFCVVTESVRQGIPVSVRVVDGAGTVLHEL
jgi:uncharacterized OsmC-like protein